MGGDSYNDIKALSMTSFNPRPRMGGDVRFAMTGGVLERFNPRPRMGGDIVGDAITTPSQVSIHAPAWGATVFS